MGDEAPEPFTGSLLAGLLKDIRDKKSAVKALFQLDIYTAVLRFLLNVRFPGIRIST